ncbi:MAG: alpha-hydroxy-acid oxidizing protein [Clostridia bacterium]|nr:alpha-hydroxy-acid oxidizing protein [Clostridia bacterium]
MANGRRTGVSDVITKAYLDSLLLEVRHLDACLPDTTLEIYGKTFKTPITTAALSHMSKNCADGMVKMAKGAHLAGAIAFSGLGAKEELEGMIAAGASVIKIIKPYKDRDSIYDKIRHAEKAGAFAVGIDIDHAFSRGRGYDEIEGMEMRPLQLHELCDMVKATKLPFIIKGVLSIRDAEKCLEAGVQGMVISHHNGRLDYSVPPLMILPEIQKRTMGRIPLFVDCGLESGIDVFKALLLGATACSIGRPLIPRLKEQGEEGVRDVILEMTKDLEYAMAMTSTKSLKDMDSSVVHFGNFTW